MDRDKTIEFLIGIMFIVFLILVVLFVVNLSDNDSNSKNTKVVYSSSDAKTNEPQVVNNYYYQKPENYDYYYKTRSTRDVVYKYDYEDYVVYKKKSSDSWDWNEDHDWRYDDWDDDYETSGKQRKTKQGFNGYLDEYRVFVENKDNEGKYFKVVFYLDDGSGFLDTEEMIKYVPGKDFEKFTYRDFHFEKYNYERWSYDVFSQDNGFN
jgi:hypothetical protein